jgi:dihydrofolate reductase
MKIHLIWAQARNGVIGRDGKLPWHMPEDLAHFKATTLGCPVVMGGAPGIRCRRAFGRCRGAPTSSSPARQTGNHDGVPVARDLAQALQMCGQLPGVATVWVIGGAQVYAQALPLARRAVVTEIEADFEGDAYAPTFGPGWQRTAREAHVSSTGVAYSFNTYDNTQI